jgi:hypothetical protein
MNPTSTDVGIVAGIVKELSLYLKVVADLLETPGIATFTL